MACVPYLTYGLDIIEVALRAQAAGRPTSAMVYFALVDALHTNRG